MPPDNYTIAEQFSLLSKLMDIHGENTFKAKSYAAAAFAIEKLPRQLSEIPTEKLPDLKGIGESAARKITEILQTGRLKVLDELLARTPAGVLEMLRIKGLGPKKIATIWKEMEIESLGELLYACNENRLLLYKGFGQKTQQNVQEAIEFFLQHQGSHLYAEAEPFVLAMDELLSKKFPGIRFSVSGAFRRQMPVVEHLTWICTGNREELQTFFEAGGFKTEESNGKKLVISGAEGIKLEFLFTPESGFDQLLFETSCDAGFLEACRRQKYWEKASGASSEKQIFLDLNLPFIPVCMREGPEVLEMKQLPDLIRPNDIRGIVHSHSNWSDGLNSLEEMAKACVGRGYEYLVISDHSKSAFYANGLSEERIRQQHLAIDELNEKLRPFRIIKSIECDILNDGSLDYTDSILESFDLVIASVHSNLKMNEEKAMMRLLGAIRHPCTSILGHMTGRLLLSRPGYPVDHRRIIDACAENQVVIELNAHPRRLDMDWSWIPYALEKKVLISINPDAHAIEGFDDCRCGVLAAQKSGLSRENNLSSFSLKEMESFIRNQHAKRRH